MPADASVSDAADAGKDSPDVAIDSPSSDPYDIGSWKSENVSNSPKTLSHDGRFAFLSDGSMRFAYAEPDAVEYNSRQAIMSAKKVGATWSSERRTPDVKQQYSFPAIVSTDTGSMILYNGYTPTTWNDIWMQREDGGTWGAAVNVTGKFATGGASADRDNTNVAVARTSTGFVIAYTSQPVVGNQRMDPVEVRLLRLGKDGAPVGSPVTVLSPKATKEFCSRPSLAVDDAQKIHLLSSCGALDTGTIYYVTDLSGAFSATAISAGKECYSPEIRPSIDGKKMHMVWACGGAVLYRRGASGTLTEEATVSQENGGDFHPTVVEDKNGTVLVAFHRNAAADSGVLYGDVWIAWSTDGILFKERNITPNTQGTDDYFPADFQLDPAGVPHLTYDTVRGVDPDLNRDVWHAWFTP